MTLELDSIISSAMETIDGGDNGGDTSGTDNGDDGNATDVSAESAADAGTDAGGESVEAESDGSGPEPTPDPARSAEDLAFDAELAELGLAAPKPGQRDNRIPYSRIRKIVANAKTKWSEKLKGEHTVELTARERKIQEFNERAAQFDAAEKLIESDGERYIGLLASIYPKQYGHLVKGRAAEEAPKPQEPQPDVKYDDGTVGYSPEQFAKLREYDRTESARIAEERATKQFNERFGPIEKDYQATQQQHQNVQRVRGHIGKLRDQWGAEAIDNPEVQKAIVAHMDANPKATLVESTREVMQARHKADLARLSADYNVVRARVLKELKGAPSAAAKAPMSPDKSSAAADSESIDDIIRSHARSLR